MAYEDDSQDYQAKPKAKYRYKKELRIRDETGDKITNL